MNNLNVTPKETLTLQNGGGIVEFYYGNYIVEGWDVQYTGDVFHQYRRVSPELFQRMKTAKERSGNEMAWSVYHEALSV